MLDKNLRKLLNEHQDWDEALRKKHDSNPYQTWKRNHDMAITAINDLVLLAETLPEDKQAELFTPERMDRLVDALLGKKVAERRTNELVKMVNQFQKRMQAETDPKRKSALKKTFEHNNEELERIISMVNPRYARLARVFSSNGLQYLVNEYHKVEKHLPIRKTVEDNLLEAKVLSSSIASKLIEEAQRIEDLADYKRWKPEWDEMTKIAGQLLTEIDSGSAVVNPDGSASFTEKGKKLLDKN